MTRPDYLPDPLTGRSCAFKPDVVLYHSPCGDGFGAAWAIRARWPDVEFAPANYDETKMPDLTGKHVLVVDFSFKAEAIRKIGRKVKSMTILDHHESAERELDPWTVVGNDMALLHSPEGLADLARTHPPDSDYSLPVQAVFDMRRSGARLAWDYVFPNARAPFLIDYVQDRDLWTWALEHSKAVSAYIQLTPLDFASFDRLAGELEDHTQFERLVDIGEILNKREEQEIKGAIKASQRRVLIQGHDVPIANLPYIFASVGGNFMAKGEPFSASYFDLPDGRRKVSLRSDGDDPAALNVSEIAEYYGGGGHKNAAGFVAPANWLGDA